jgi:hypothetical protein
MTRKQLHLSLFPPLLPRSLPAASISLSRLHASPHQRLARARASKSLTPSLLPLHSTSHQRLASLPRALALVYLIPFNEVITTHGSLVDRQPSRFVSYGGDIMAPDAMKEHHFHDLFLRLP